MSELISFKEVKRAMEFLDLLEKHTDVLTHYIKPSSVDAALHKLGYKSQPTYITSAKEELYE